MSIAINITRLTGKSSLLKQGRPKFCWLCGKKFYGNKVYTVVFRDYGLHYVHKSCAEKEIKTLGDE